MEKPLSIAPEKVLELYDHYYQWLRSLGFYTWLILLGVFLLVYLIPNDTVPTVSTTLGVAIANGNAVGLIAFSFLNAVGLFAFSFINAAGLIAVSQINAAGIIALGGVNAVGVIAISGVNAVGFIAVGGRNAVGYVAIGRNTIGVYCFSSTGLSSSRGGIKHMLSPNRQDPEAIEFFSRRFARIKSAIL